MQDERDASAFEAVLGAVELDEADWSLVHLDEEALDDRSTMTDVLGEKLLISQSPASPLLVHAGISEEISKRVEVSR